MSINQLFGNILPMVHYKHITLESGADENPLELDPHIQEMSYPVSHLWLEYSSKIEGIELDPNSGDMPEVWNQWLVADPPDNDKTWSFDPTNVPDSSSNMSTKLQISIKEKYDPTQERDSWLFDSFFLEPYTHGGEELLALQEDLAMVCCL